MRFRACWILLGGSFAEACVGLSWLVRGDLFIATLLGVTSAIHLAVFLVVEHHEPVEGVRLW